MSRTLAAHGRLGTVALAVTVAIAGLVAACGGDVPPSGGASPSDPSGVDPGATVPVLAGTSWIVVTVNDRKPIAGAVPTISFDATRVRGFFGCNQGGGSYRLEPATGQFAIVDLGATAMGCLGVGVTEFETAFLTALGGATRAMLQPTGRLVLSGPGAQIVLVPLEHPAAP